MTKIIIKNRPGIYEISIIGHADKINDGDGNILCAAVSMLSQTLLQQIRDMDDAGVIKHKESVAAGYIRIICYYQNKNYIYLRGVLETIETGFVLLKEKYKKNIYVVGEIDFYNSYDTSKDARERPQEE